MTLELLISYLWHDMPMTGWGAIIAGCLAIAGTAIWLNGRLVMRVNSSYLTSVEVSADGVKRESVSSSFGIDYGLGKSMAQLGMWMVLFALVSLSGFLRLW